MKSCIACCIVPAAVVGFALLGLPAEQPARAEEDSVEQQQILLKEQQILLEEPVDESPDPFRAAHPGGLEDLFLTTRATESRPERASQKIRNGVKKLSSAKDEASQEEAKKVLEATLVEYFDEDMKQREQEIAKVEQRIKKLREQLEKRRAAKDSIIALQLQVLENEAAGLGFFSEPATGRYRD